jgi:Uma2 family endonuclease
MVAPVVIRKRFTSREYEQIIAAGVFAEDDRVELLEGEIVEMSPIGPSHSGCVLRLTELLYKMQSPPWMVRVQDPIHLSEFSEPQPDISVVQRRSDYYANGHPEPEDILLLIEVSESSLAYDRDIKLPLYARAGIPEVWVVALLHQTVDVYRLPGEDGYGEKRMAQRGDVLTAVNLPGVSLDVADILG